MKILITGGAGFLGLHLAQHLNKKFFSITLVDIADFNKREYPRSCKFFKVDIRNKITMYQCIKTVDVVIHAAAALPLWKKKEIVAVNVDGTKNLLDASLKNKIKHFIYISSTAVYGIPNLPAGRQEMHPIYEDSPLVGVGPYGQSKIAAEKLCEQYRQKGLLVTIIRPKTFVGTHRLGVFEILFDWIKDGKRIPVIGSGNNRYQLLDVDDLVEAIYKIIIFKDKKKVNTTFNIGAEEFKTVKEDLQEVFDYGQSGSKILPTPALLIKKALWIFEKMRLSPLYQWVYDTADHDSYVSVKYLTGVLHWHPRYSNAQALIKAYQWYLDNYQEIKLRPAGVTHTAGWKQGILGWFKRFL